MLGPGLSEWEKGVGTQAEAAAEIGSSCGQLGRDGEESTCTREKLQRGRAFPFLLLLLLPLCPLPYLPPPLPFSLLLLLLHLLQLRLQLLWGAAHLSGTGQAASSRAGTPAGRGAQGTAPGTAAPGRARGESRWLGTEAGGGSELGAQWRPQNGAKVSRRLLKAPLRLPGGEGLLETAGAVRKTGSRGVLGGGGGGGG